MGTDLNAGPSPLVPAAQPAAPPTLPPEKKQHRVRFMVVYAVLGIAIGGAVAGAIMLSNSKTATQRVEQQAKWAPWQPAFGNEHSVAHQIASRVTQEYGTGLGGLSHIVLNQDPLQLQPPMVAVDVRSKFGIFNLPRQSELALTGNSWLYEICGTAQACSLTASRPGQSAASLQRQVVQEMLELSLYTFKYLPRIQSVIVLLPPTAKSQSNTSVALFMPRAAATPLLTRPLRAVVGRPGYPSAKVSQSIVPHLYNVDPGYIQQLPDQSFILSLDRPPSGN